MNNTLSIDDYRRIIALVCSSVQSNRTNDVYNITNSISDNQIACKEWLLHEFTDMTEMMHTQPQHIVVIGGWVGLMAHMIQTAFPNTTVINTDVDEATIKIGKKMFPDVKHKVKDINEVNVEQFDTIICTSYEHINQDKINKMIGRCRHNTLLILQGNNYREIPDHINCHDTPEEFVSSIPATNLWWGTELRDKYTRYMAICRT